MNYFSRNWKNNLMLLIEYPILQMYTFKNIYNCDWKHNEKI
jgi:hypothetical protein